jgi:hypothetical protein
MKNELERTLKEMNLTQLEILSQHLFGGTEEKLQPG